MRTFQLYIPGLLILFVGCLLFWLSLRPHLTERVKVTLEVQGAACMPLGVVGLAFGAFETFRRSRFDHEHERRRREREHEREHNEPNG